MKFTTLGRTGEEISAIGFGGMPLSIQGRPPEDVGRRVINAAIDGLGVALAKKNWVEADLAAGRLVRPFDISLLVEFSYFLVYPESRADDPLIAAFAGWIRREVAKGSPEGATSGP